jgi:hypothetical protein
MEYARRSLLGGRFSIAVGPAGAFALVAALLLAMTFLSARPSAALAAECANEAMRIEQGVSSLGDCRAYEMVTPVDKGSGGPEPIEQSEFFEGRELTPLNPEELFGAAGAQSAVDGDRMAWLSEPMPAATGYGINQISERGSDGWVSHDLVPPLSVTNDVACPFSLGVSGWSPDLTKAILDLPAGPPATNAAGPLGFFEEHECGHDEPRLVAGESEHFRNLFVHDDGDQSNRLVNLTPQGVLWPEPEEVGQQYWPASLVAASADMSHVVFEEELPLTKTAEEVSPEVEEACERAERACWQGQDNLYEWAGGVVRLVTVLEGPGGEEVPVHGSLAGATRNYRMASPFVENSINIAEYEHAISTDGSRVYFEAPGDEAAGDLYLREDGARTIQVDLAEAGAPGPSGGGDFRWASADGSRVFFTDANELTSDSHAEPGKPDLYEYSVGSGSLRDLTAGPEAAGVLGVAGAAADGSSAFFVAEAALTAVPNSQGATASAGEPNLYAWRSGAIVFVATLEREFDQCDWTTTELCNRGIFNQARETGLTSRTSDDGGFLAFDSIRRLTGYDNTSPVTGQPLLEIYLYDVATGSLVCASCNPTGAPMKFGAAIKSPSTRTARSSVWRNAYPQRNLSDHGQVFFETADSLLPSDGNGRRDVYEYADGRLSLISSGVSESGSYFLDASPDGANVFFATSQPLLKQDVDTLYDYYDARVDGGFPQPQPPPPPCGGETCKGSPSPAPSTSAPGTEGVGGGNVRKHADCSSFSHRASGLRKQADRARSKAKRVGPHGKQGKHLSRRERSLNKQARQLDQKARSCKTNQRTRSSHA